MANDGRLDAWATESPAEALQGLRAAHSASGYGAEPHRRPESPIGDRLPTALGSVNRISGAVFSCAYPPTFTGLASEAVSGGSGGMRGAKRLLRQHSPLRGQRSKVKNSVLWLTLRSVFWYWLWGIVVWGCSMDGNRDDFRAMSETSPTPKKRMTLLLAPEVKDELKRQAREAGVSPSAYVSVLVSQQRGRD